MAGRARSIWESLTKYQSRCATGWQSHQLIGTSKDLQTVMKGGGYVENGRKPFKNVLSTEGMRPAFSNEASKDKLG